MTAPNFAPTNVVQFSLEVTTLAVVTQQFLIGQEASGRYYGEATNVGSGNVHKYPLFVDPDVTQIGILNALAASVGNVLAVRGHLANRCDTIPFNLPEFASEGQGFVIHNIPTS